MILTCVVTHNRLAYTKRCVESLLATARPQDRLYVVDNASTDGTQAWLRTVSVGVIENRENRFPGAACNQVWDWRSADLLHRSDNDIEYLPGWQNEVERAFEADPDLALLGILNLHEDRDLDLSGESGIDIVDAVGGNVVTPGRLGLRWSENPWAPGGDEDAEMSKAAARVGRVGRLRRTVANNMAFCRYDDFPDYYDRTAALRGIADARHSV